jgi:hypothetical protein
MAKINIGGLWIQPGVRYQSRLGFNIDFDEVDEWTEEQVEIAEIMSTPPAPIKR